MGVISSIFAFVTGYHPLLSALVQILLLAICIYILLRTFRHTPSIYAISTLIGLALLLALLTHIFQSSVLGTLCWYLLKGLPLATIIILQQDLRRLFLIIANAFNPQHWSLLKSRNLSRRNQEIASRIDALVKTVCCLTTSNTWRRQLQEYGDELSLLPHLSSKNIGALIALQGSQGLLPIIEEHGVPLDARFDHKHPASFILLLLTIFHPGSPLHDGGVILSENFRVLAAGCLFPQNQIPLHGPAHTRHNAAIGISQNTDALVIVVSEENGNVSVASEGMLRRLHSPEELSKLLNARYRPVPTQPPSPFND